MSLLELGKPVDLSATVNTGRQLDLFKTGNFRYGMAVAAGATRIFAGQGDSIAMGHIASADGTTFLQKWALDANGNVSMSGKLSSGGAIDLTGALGADQVLLFDASGLRYGLQVAGSATRLFSAAGDGVSFGTKAASTYAYTEWAKLLPPGDGGTPLYLLCNRSGVLTLDNVTLGAADSGGSGRKALTVPN
jgi:hypothetical protein